MVQNISVPSVVSCSKCHMQVRPTDYFCFNCGANLKPKPLSTSIGKQIVIYISSVILAPFGVIWGMRYIRQPSMKAKVIGMMAIFITMITVIVVTVYTIKILNEAQAELQRQLQNIGY